MGVERLAMDDLGTCAAVRYANELHAAVERCAIGLGWPLVLSGGNVYLPVGRGVIGVAMAAVFASRVEVGGGPVLAYPGRVETWVVLVDQPEVGNLRVPPNAVLVDRPGYLALPPSHTPGGPVRWVCPPRTDRRVLPSFASVYEAIWRAAPA
ncbi:hypothetical protein [Actinosynnema sp. NPDC020468]|uniref:hypothetical protein n=1 Tax=Actinosynnema sp. NPDC020468 TaxID=3154488 RepID=UPI0033FB24A4